MNRILIICGPTATGKTDLAVKLAKKFQGEIISADSRQVYQGMDIGTGKDINKNSKLKPPAFAKATAGKQNPKLKTKKFNIGYRFKDGIPVWLVDVVEPDYRFNVGEYAKLAKMVVADIQSRNRLPIVVGGTGLYIKALVEPLNYVSIPPNPQLRTKLEQKSVAELQQELIKLNQDKFKSMNDSDQKNPRRLIRAIEIISNLERKNDPTQFLKEYRNYFRQLNHVVIGLKMDLPKLYQRIDKRVNQRVKQGIINEIKSLLNKGYVWDLPAMSGLGYKEWKPYMEMTNDKFLISKKEKRKLLGTVIEQWKLHERQYAKRQITWFKKQIGIEWFDTQDDDYINQVINKVKLWYDKK